MPIPTNKDIAEVTYNGVTIPLAESGGEESVQEVFVVEYDETTFEDIYDAFQAGKICYFDYLGERFYAFKCAPNNIFFFYIYRGGIKKYAICGSSTGWSEIENDLELLTENSIVTEITASSTDTKVPSAKAVYDLVQSSGREAVQEIFDVTYNTTLFSDIYAAHQSGKLCRIIYNGNVYYMSLCSTTVAIFKHDGNGTIRKIIACSSDNTWQSDNQNVQLSASKVTEITSASTDSQYPSAKAVYDLVQSSGGGGVSEIFRVVYGTTPFADTYAALQNGKICVTEWIGDMYYCCHYDDDIIVFKFSGNNGVQQLIMCSPSNQWQLLNITLGIDSITGLRAEFGNFAEALDGKISCTDAQVASYGYLKLSDLPVWDGSVV